MNEYFGLDASQPVVLLIGFNTNATSVGVLSTVKASGRQYKIKMLESSPENWEVIVTCFTDFDVSCVVVRLTDSAYRRLVDPTYQYVSDKLLEQILQVPHAIFAHEQYLSNKIDEAEDKDDEAYTRSLYPPLPVEVLDAVNNIFKVRGFNVLSYSTNAELNVLASAFVTEADEGLIFRIYVPNGRIWANETDRLIQLFRDYLTRVGQLSVRLDQQRTRHGIVYEFYSTPDTENPGIVDAEDLSIQFREFSQFLDLAVFNPSEAEAILKSKHINPNEVIGIVTRYAKEAKRLQVDIRHEREQKVLGIRQRLESELLDALPINATPGMIAALVEAAVPSTDSLASAVNVGERFLVPATQGNSLTINFNPQFVHAVNSVVAQEIQGDVSLSEQDQELLQLIRQHAQDREMELVSAVHQLADDSAPGMGRLTAKKKVTAFLSQLGSKAGAIGVELLKFYLKKEMGL